MRSKQFFSSLLLALALLGVSINSFAQHESTPVEAQHDGEKKKGFDASEVIFGHIRDSHYWHLFDISGEPVSFSLPVIIYDNQKGLSFFSASKFHHGHESYEGYKIDESNKIKEKIVAVNPVPGQKIYDLSITKNVLSMLISIVLLLWLLLGVAKKYKNNGTMTAPKGMQNAMEPIIIFLRDEVAKPNLGAKYLRYMPLIMTIFFFIWINSLLGLLPGGANFNGNIAFTACLALISFIVILFSANKHFWGHLLNPPGVPFGIKLLLVPIEILSLFIKPVALMIRLFANMLAGHIVILSVISMIFIFGSLNAIAGWGFMPISLAFTVFMFFLELLVGAIQAFIFANLTAVFIGQSIEEPHHHNHPIDYHGHDVAHPELTLSEEVKN
ncbi:MAG: F0F1 ATP synthase subunit A [Bacteroidetes bacterium]|nr:F0F1 ATP synthase subunit A [Bacteroidota bacterium]